MRQQGGIVMVYIMSGTRNVPMKSLQEMTHYKRVESKQDANAFEQQEEEKQGYKKILIEKEMQKLVDAETISNVEDIRESLHDKKLEIENSDMTEMKKQRSLDYLENIQVKCNNKIRKLRHESNLQRLMENAEEQGDIEEVAHLMNQYTHEKSLRKTDEYSKLHASIMGAHKKVQLYSASQKAVDLFAEMNGAGNYVNVISASI